MASTTTITTADSPSLPVPGNRGTTIQYGSISLEVPLRETSLSSILGAPEFDPAAQYDLMFDGQFYGRGSLLHVILAHGRITLNEPIPIVIALVEKAIAAGVDVNSLDSRGAPVYFYVRDEEVFDALRKSSKPPLRLDVVDSAGQGVFHYLIADRPSALYAEGNELTTESVTDSLTKTPVVVRRRSSLGGLTPSSPGMRARAGSRAGIDAPDLRRFARALVKAGLHPFVADKNGVTPHSLVHQQIVGSVRAQTMLDEAAGNLLSARAHSDIITLFLHYTVAKLPLPAAKSVFMELSPIFVSLLDRKVKYFAAVANQPSQVSPSTPEAKMADTSVGFEHLLETDSPLLFVPLPGIKLIDMTANTESDPEFQNTLETAMSRRDSKVREELLKTIASTKLLGATNISELSAALRAGADPNYAGRGGETALMNATRISEPVQAVKLLLEARANPNAANVHGVTPLMRCNRPDCFRLLLEANADPNAKTRSGVTVAESLIRGEADSDVVALQATAKAAAASYAANPENQALAVAATQAASQAAAALATADVRTGQCLKILHARGVDITRIVTRRGQPLLHLVTGEYVAKALLEARADVMQRDYSNELCIAPIVRNPAASPSLIALVIDKLAEARTESQDYAFTKQDMLTVLGQIGEANVHYAGIRDEFKAILAERQANAQLNASDTGNP